MICCTICGMWYPHVGPDRLDICNRLLAAEFLRQSPDGPTAREALEAFVDSAHPLTPRQVAAMARMAAVWQQEETP